MDKIHQIGNTLQTLLQGSGIEKFAFRVTEKETEEFNAEGDSFTLYRTLFDNGVQLTVFSDGRMGTAGGNDVSREGLEALVRSAVGAAEAAEPDPAHDVAPLQKAPVFRTGCHEPDMDRFFFRFSEMLQTIRTEYPLIRITLSVASHVKKHTIYRNSNGTDLEKFGGYYTFGLEFAANDGENTTSIDFVELEFTDLDKPLLSLGSVRKHLEDTTAQLHRVPLRDKFTGTVILTPDCLEMMLYYLLQNTVMNSVVLNGTSLWLDKVGQKVADEALTLKVYADHPEQADPECFTPDGFLSRDVTILERGVLKSQLLNLYVSNKTGRPVTKLSEGFVVLEPGTESLSDVIRRVRRGLIVGYYSGGEPEANGEFSGVAKNSFYVEDGKIVGAVSEAMINGNLLELIENVTAITSDQVRVSAGLMPYLAADNVVISG